MANDSSLVKGDQFAFDLETQKGLLMLLAAVRASELSAAQKNEIRDLAFLYTNGGRDTSVRISLQQKVQAYGLQPVKGTSVAAAPAAVPPPAFGTSRPAPTFSVPVAAVTTPVVESQPQPEPTPAPAPIPQPAPVQSVPPPVVPEPVQPVPEPVPPPAPVVSVPPPPQPEPVIPVVDVPVAPAPEPVVPPSPEVQTPTPTPSLEPVPVVAPPVPPVQPEAEAPVAYDTEVATQRIREIKSLVNEKVGNPVNLVDINNEVGREYMSALLDAMKKISSGTSVISAMKRLETAFVSVQETLRAHELGQTQVPNPAVPVQPTPAHDTIAEESAPAVETPAAQPLPSFSEPAPMTQVPLAANPVAEEPVAIELEASPLPEVPISPRASMPSDEPVFVPPAPTPIDSERDNVFETVPSIDDAIPPVPEPVAESVAPIISEVERTRVLPAGAPGPIPMKRSEGGIDSAWGPATDTLPPVMDTRHTISSLADSGEKLRSIDELPKASDISTAVGGDPLSTKEVDDGLQQLLSEWSLFKKSGLFGTGPKGREHPLFLKIAGLQIPLLLAGRFEGATQEIKQSITDYMNGWRYEQGIIYEQGETFEHYLRRVIRHILDLQKRRHQS